MTAKNAKNKLTNLEVKSFVDKGLRGSKLYDGGGLFITIPPRGQASWRVRYNFDSKEKLFTIGVYPMITLAEARVVHAKVLGQVKQGIDPVSARKVDVLSNTASSGNTFKVISEMWFSKMKAEWGDKHYKKSTRAIERDLFPMLGSLPIANIDSYILAQAVLSTAIKRGSIETADRVLTHASIIFNFAKGLGVYHHDNPVVGAREVAMPKAVQTKNIPALLEWKELGAILREAKGANIAPSLYMLHRLIAFTTIRIGTARLAEWSEFDLDSNPPLWTIPRAKMKMKHRKNDHRIPLSVTLVNELKEWRSIGLKGSYLFPSPQQYNRHKPVSADGLEKAYRIQLGLKGKHSPHSWRSAFSTRGNDGHFRSDVIELTLDHCHNDSIAMIYDRGERFDQRIKLFEWWGESLTLAENKKI